MSPAVALIETLQASHKKYQIVFAGRKYAFEDDRSVSQEYTIITGRNIRFYSIITGRLQRAFSGKSLLSLAKLPFGIMQSFLLCVREKPDVIVSFGGYIALPVVLSGWVLGIPVMTHEQTTVLGLANRFILRLSRVVCVSFPEMADISHPHVVVTGLPLRRGILHPPEHPTFQTDNSRPKLYITGGTTGAESINQVVFSALPELVQTYTVIHQTGSRSLEDAKTAAAALQKEHTNHYIYNAYFEPDDVGWILQHCAFAVSRSGANAIAEYLAIGCPAIVIPLPWSGGNEQQFNAERFVSRGMGVILSQKTLSSQTLLATIQQFSTQVAQYKRSAQSGKKDDYSDGAELVLKQIDLLLS